MHISHFISLTGLYNWFELTPSQTGFTALYNWFQLTPKLYKKALAPLFVQLSWNEFFVKELLEGVKEMPWS